MAITIGVPTLRCTLILLNMLCFLSGLSLAIVGAVMHTKLAAITNLTHRDNLLTSQSLLAMGLGVIIFAVSFFGFCGAAKHSYCMTVTYVLMLMTLIVVQIALAVLLFAGVDQNRHDYLEWFDEYFDHNISVSKASSVVDPVIDYLQTTYGCCGKISFLDWGNKLPDSCCADGQRGPNCVPFKEGCERMLEGYIRQTGKIIGWILMWLTVFEFIALTLACCLANGIKNRVDALYFA
ncbi:AAEL013918-PA [Aedes aegypti]|uniref:Tetraspanin n=2 Tax=Aedes aegypti TaxID=7159 RepID=A0A1S4G0W6_AEDAE|nr:CD63 antigen [Aedes aegypti]EAT33805.1 AAEL013918-PA [Aedes aegypti]